MQWLVVRCPHCDAVAAEIFMGLVRVRCRKCSVRLTIQSDGQRFTFLKDAAPKVVKEKVSA